MLDLAKVSQQISRMAVEQQLVAEDRLKRLDKALGQLGLESGRLPAFMRKLQASKTSWLLAGIRESLENTYATTTTAVSHYGCSNGWLTNRPEPS